jgi:hypothetical protein
VRGPTGLERTGLDGPPRIRPVAVTAGAGLLWGAFSYSVLWDGSPFPVDRPFVESVAGTLILLPARIVLWAVHAGEEIAGHTFDLSRSTWMFGLAAASAGVVLGVLVGTAVTLLLRFARR